MTPMMPPSGDQQHQHDDARDVKTRTKQNNYRALQALRRQKIILKTNVREWTGHF